MFPLENAGAGDVIMVIVGDDNAFDPGRIAAGGDDVLNKTSAGQPGVDEDRPVRTLTEYNTSSRTTRWPGRQPS